MTPKQAVWTGVSIMSLVTSLLLVQDPGIAIMFLFGMAAGATLAGLVVLQRQQAGTDALHPEKRNSPTECFGPGDE